MLFDPIKTTVMFTVLGSYLGLNLNFGKFVNTLFKQSYYYLKQKKNIISKAQQFLNSVSSEV